MHVGGAITESESSSKAARGVEASVVKQLETLRVLLVSTDTAFGSVIFSTLRGKPRTWKVSLTREAGTAMQLIGRQRYDVVVVDLPAYGARATLGFCSDARAVGISIPIVLVVSDDAEDTLVDAIKAGADDVIVKPRSSRIGPCDRIAVAFVRSIIWASHGQQEGRMVSVGQLSVDLDSEAVLLHGRSLELTPHHRRLLLRLARRNGRFVPVAELRECAGIQADRENKNLRNQIWRLRRRLVAADCLLEGAPRQGYRLVSASRSRVAS